MLRRRFLHFAALLPAAGSLLVPPWRAQATGIPVADAMSLGQLGEQLITTGQQLDEMRRQVEYLRNAARKLDPRSYRSIGALLEGDALTYDSITRDVKTIGYTLEGVNRRFKQYFPDEESVKNMRPSDHAETSQQMNQELYGAALVAHRAQTNLSTIEENQNQAKQILERSGAEDSQVAQIQSAIQMLALVHDNLDNITQTISSASRVSTDLAAAGVTEHRITRERKRRYVKDFSRPIEPTGIDERFLEVK